MKVGLLSPSVPPFDSPRAARLVADPDDIALIAEAAPATVERAGALRAMGVSVVLVYPPQVPADERSPTPSRLRQSGLGPSRGTVGIVQRCRAAVTGTATGEFSVASVSTDRDWVATENAVIAT